MHDAADPPRELGRRAEVDGDDDDAREDAAPERGDPLRPVLGPEQNGVALAEPRFVQAAGEAPGGGRHLTVAIAAGPEPVVVDQELAGSSRPDPRRTRRACRGAWLIIVGYNVADAGLPDGCEWVCRNGGARRVRAGGTPRDGARPQFREGGRGCGQGRLAVDRRPARAGESYRQAAEGHDAFIHAGFDGTRPVETDRLAIETLVAAARAGRSGRPSVLDLHLGHLGARADAPPGRRRRAPRTRRRSSRFRPAHEQMVLSAAGDGLRTAVVRPGIVYGGSRGIVGDLFRHAVNGVIRIIGTGENHWPAVYDRDLADLYLLLAQREDASGVFHANDESDERVNDIVDGDRGAHEADAGRAARAARGGPGEARPLRGCPGARPGDAQPACPRPWLVARAEVDCGQCRPTARRVAG